MTDITEEATPTEIVPADASPIDFEALVSKLRDDVAIFCGEDEGVGLEGLCAALQQIGDNAREEEARNKLSEQNDLIPLLSSCIKQSIASKKLLVERGEKDGGVKADALDGVLKLCIRSVGNLCYEHVDNCKRCSELNVVQDLVAIILSTPSSAESTAQQNDVLSNTAGALTNLASDSRDIQQTIFGTDGAMASLVSLLTRDDNERLQGMAASALRNLADSGMDMKAVGRSGLVAALLKIITPEPGVESSYTSRGLAMSCLALLVKDRGICDSVIEQHKGLGVLFNVASSPLSPKEGAEEVERRKRKIDHQKMLASGNAATNQQTHILAETDENDLRQAAAACLREISENKTIYARFSPFLPALLEALVETANMASDPSAVPRLVGAVAASLHKVVMNLSMVDEFAEDLFAQLHQFVALLEADDEDARVVACMVLGNVARGEEKSAAMVNGGAIPPLLKLIKVDEEKADGEASTMEQVGTTAAAAAKMRVMHLSLGAIRNITVSSKVIHAQMLKAGALEICAGALEHSHAFVQFSAVLAVKTLLNDSAGDGPKRFDDYGPRGLEQIVKLATMTCQEGLGHERIVYESARVLVNLCEVSSMEGAVDWETKVAEAGGVEGLYNLVKATHPLLQFEGARALWHIASRSESLAKRVAGDKGADVTLFLPFLMSPSQEVRVSALALLLEVTKDEETKEVVRNGSCVKQSTVEGAMVGAVCAKLKGQYATNTPVFPVTQTAVGSMSEARRVEWNNLKWSDLLEEAVKRFTPSK